jgi:hypothetical protein
MNELTPRSWVLLEKPPVAQLPKNFPAIYGIWKLMIVFIRALHWSLSKARRIHSMSLHLISPRSILILSSQQCLCIYSGLFLFGFHTWILFTFIMSPMSAISHPSRLDHSNYIWREVQVMKLLIKRVCPTTCHFIHILLSTLFSNTLTLCSSLDVRHKVSHS